MSGIFSSILGFPSDRGRLKEELNEPLLETHSSQVHPSIEFDGGALDDEPNKKEKSDDSALDKNAKRDARVHDLVRDAMKSN